MNAFIKITLFSLLFIGLPNILAAQEGSDTTTVSYKMYVVVKNDGTEYVGQILKQDSREVLIKTDKLGEIYIPKHEIKEIREIENIKEYKSGVSFRENRMASRYYLTTSAIPLGKGNDYFRLTYFLLEAQFALGDNFSLGVMTTPVGAPIVLTPKFGYEVADKFHLGGGLLFGSLSWTRPDYGGLFGYGLATYGTKNHNVTLGAGYGFVYGDGNVSGQNAPLISMGSHLRIGSSAFFNFEALIVVNSDFALGALIPGVRWVTKKQNVWDFGFTGGFFSDRTGGGGAEVVPLPIPMISWTTFFK